MMKPILILLLLLSPGAVQASNPIAESYKSYADGTTYYVFDENGVGAIIRSHKPPKTAKSKSGAKAIVVSEKEYKAGKQYNNSSMNEAQASKAFGIPAKRVTELGVLVNLIDTGIEKQTLIDKRSNAPSAVRPTEQSVTDTLIAAGIKPDKVNLNELAQVGAFWCKVVLQTSGGKLHGANDLKRVLGVLFGPKNPAIQRVEVLVRTEMTDSNLKSTGSGDLLRAELDRSAYSRISTDVEGVAFLDRLKTVGKIWEHPSVRDGK